MTYSGLSIWFTDKENTLFNTIGRELVETLICQHFTLYRIDLDETESNFYGESKHKIYKTPIEVKARIQIADEPVVSEGGIRRYGKGDLISWVYLDHLSELGVTISVGDFIGFQGKIYEVYDNSPNKDSMNRKFAGDRDYYQEIIARVVKDDVFNSIDGQGYSG